MTEPALHSDAVEVFRRAAATFCRIVDSREALLPGELVKELAKAIPALYLAGVHLTEVYPKTDEVRAGKEPLDRWEELWRSLRQKLGDVDVYWHVFDPTEREEPVVAHLSDDIADIYRDVRPAIDIESPSDDDLWCWRFDFENHWGRHATTALGAVHALSKVLQSR